MATAALALSAPGAQAAMLGTDAQVGSNAPTPAVGPVGGPESSPFSWADAGLGAAAMVLIVGAGLGSVRLSRLTRTAQQSLRTS